jgi:hypothetical protein
MEVERLRHVGNAYTAAGIHKRVSQKRPNLRRHIVIEALEHSSC